MDVTYITECAVNRESARNKLITSLKHIQTRRKKEKRMNATMIVTQTIITNMRALYEIGIHLMRIVNRNIEWKNYAQNRSVDIIVVRHARMKTKKNEYRWGFVVKFQIKIKLIALFDFYGLQCERIQFFFFIIIIINALFDLLSTFHTHFRRSGKKEVSFSPICEMNSVMCSFSLWSTVCSASMHDDVR